MQEHIPSPFMQELADLIAKNDFTTFKEKYLNNPNSYQFSKEELDQHRYLDGDTLLHKAVQNNGLSFIHWLLERKIDTELTARKDRGHGHYTYQASYAKTDKKEFVTPAESAHQKGFFAAADLLEMYGAVYQKSGIRVRTIKQIDQEIVEDLFDAIKNSNASKKQKLLKLAEEKHRSDDALIVVNVLAPHLAQKALPITSNENSNNPNIDIDESQKFMDLVKTATKENLLENQHHIFNILDRNLEVVLKKSIFCRNSHENLHTLTDEQKKYAYWIGEYYLHKANTISQILDNKDKIENLVIKALIYFLLPANTIEINYASKEANEKAHACLLKVLKLFKDKDSSLPNLFSLLSKTYLYERFLTIFFELQTQFGLSHFVLAKIFYRTHQLDLAEACFAANDQIDTRFKHNLCLFSDTQALSDSLSTFYYADIQFQKWLNKPQQIEFLETACACYLQITLNGSKKSVPTFFALGHLKEIDTKYSATNCTRRYILAYYLSTDPAKIDYFSFRPIQLATALTIVRPKLSSKQHNDISSIIFSILNSPRFQNNKDELHILRTIGLEELHLAIEQGNQEAIAKAADPKFDAQLPLSLCAKLVDDLWTKLQTINKEIDPELHFETLQLLKFFVNKFTRHSPQNPLEEKEITNQLDKWATTLDKTVFAFALANRSLSNKKLPKNTNILETLFYCLQDREALEKVEQLTQKFHSFAYKFNEFVINNQQQPRLLLPILSSEIIQNSLHEEILVDFLFNSAILPFVDSYSIKQHASKIVTFFKNKISDHNFLPRVTLDIFQKLLDNINNAEIARVVNILLQEDPTAFTKPAITHFNKNLLKKDTAETTILLKIFLNHLDNKDALSLVRSLLENHLPSFIQILREHFECATFVHAQQSANLLIGSASLLSELEVKLFTKLTSPPSQLEPFFRSDATNFTIKYINLRYQKITTIQSSEYSQEKAALLFNLYRLVLKISPIFVDLYDIAIKFNDPLANFLCGCFRNKITDTDYTKMKTDFERSFKQSFPLPAVNVSWKKLPLHNSDEFDKKWEQQTSGPDIFARIRAFIEDNHSLGNNFPLFINNIDSSLSTYEDEVFLSVLEWIIAANKEAATSLNQSKYKSLAQDLWQVILMLNQPPCQFDETCEQAESLNPNAIEKLETEYVKRFKFERRARIQLIKTYVKGSYLTTFPYPDSYPKALAHINALVTYHDPNKNNIEETIEYLNSLINENHANFQPALLKSLAKLCLHSDELIIKHITPIMSIYNLAPPTSEVDEEAKKLVIQYESTMIRLLQESTKFKNTINVQELATLLRQDNILNQLFHLNLINDYLTVKQINYFTQTYIEQRKHPLFPAIVKCTFDACMSEDNSAMLLSLKTFADQGDALSCFLYSVHLKLQNVASVEANTYLETASSKGFLLATTLINDEQQNSYFEQIWNKDNNAALSKRMVALFEHKTPGFYSTTALSPNLIANLEKLKNDNPLLIIVTLAIEYTDMTIKDNNALEKMAFVIQEIINPAANHVIEPGNENDTTEEHQEDAVAFINEL